VLLYSKNFVENSISEEFVESIPEVKIAVYFFTGRHDYCDPFALTEEYFQSIRAPEKHVVWFEESAHFPFDEEPTVFARHMHEVRGAKAIVQ